MKSADIKKIRKKMEKTLDSARFEHTLGVTYTAACLAMRYDADITKAQIAGLLHDCAKCMSDEKRLEICNKHDIPITEIEYRHPHLLHGKVGAYLAKHKYEIDDIQIQHAIAVHTTGCPHMNLLDKIIYIADYMEPGRKQAPNLSAIRKAAFEDLDKALLMILEDTLSYLHSTGSVVDTMTQKTYDFYSQYL